MAGYIICPFYAFGGFHYWSYDWQDIRNLFMNVICPVILFVPFTIFGNIHAKKSGDIVRFPILWAVLILVVLALISFGILVGALFVFPNLLVYFMVSWFFGMAFFFNILVWSVIAFKRSFRKAVEKSNDAKE